MIQLRSILRSADNSGVKRLMVIHVRGGSRRRSGGLGDKVLAVVKQAVPSGMVKKGEKVEGVIVRTKRAYRRPDGSYVRFDDNALVIIGAQGEPQGTRIFGPVAREVKEKGFAKIASMAKELI